MSADVVVPYRCSFCNKDQHDVAQLIAGPSVFICNECVEVCQEIISGKYDQPSASEEIVGIAWPLNTGNMTKCRTCGHIWPSLEPGAKPQ